MNYLSELKSHLRLDQGVKDEFLLEVNTHVEDKIQELTNSGLSEEEARKQVATSMGPSKLIAQQIYEVYSQGTWKQSLFAALPHVLIATFFALHILPNVLWLIGLAFVSIVTTIYGWCKGKPNWLFPWLGCLLLPAIIVGIMLIYLPSGWTWFAALTYIPLAVIVLIMVVKQTLKRDWLFISLMMLPVPIVTGWILSFSLENKFLDSEHIYETGSWIALSFAILALSVIFFIRIRRRWLKAWILLIPELVILAVVAMNSGKISFIGWLILSLLSIVLILGPALLERNLKRFNYRLFKK